jgi:pimeloyl-ACP methyl ester carboxylesterase
MGSTRRTILAAGAAAAATAAVQQVFAQQSGKGTGKFYEKGPVRIYYEEAGAGFPLMLLPGGGLNSTISFFTGNSPFNAIEEFKGQYRCITADLRNAPSGQSTGPVEVDRPWESYADDQLGLMDHLGIDKFMVMGFCIGGPFIWKSLEARAQSYSRGRAGAARGLASGDARPAVPRRILEDLGSGADCQAARDHHADDRPIRDQDVRNQPRLRLHRDTRFRA